MPAFTNIAAYRFASLAELPALRERLLAFCKARQLRGTILLSTEGINLFVAGPRNSIDELLAELRAIPGLEALSAKFSESDEPPFSRMLVKIKKEIIAFGVPGIDPVTRPSPRIDAKQLKQWLDDGRPLVLLDTRNDFEVKLGTFRNAVPIGIACFRDFPTAVERLPEEMKLQAVVTFCTGGIRCEKAGPYLEREGFREVYQLDGGILKYFEECGGEHFDGECFVFDQRVGLEADLGESDRSLCFVCQSVLNAEDLRDPRYVEGQSCPHCFLSANERIALALAERRQAVQRAVHPLPGSFPAENLRPLKVSSRFAGLPIAEFLQSILGKVNVDWPAEIAAGSLLDGEHHPVSPERIVKDGERFFHRRRDEIEPDVNPAIRLIYEDAALIVIDKPAPLPVHACGRFHRNTLREILRTVYAPEKPRPAHRLDANTTGVIVFTRTVQHARFVQSQFEAGTVEKVYLTRIVGHPPDDVFECREAISASRGEAGARGVDESGLPALTEFRVHRREADGTAIVEAWPRTGRTNQIRIHFWNMGFPVVGDPIYLPSRRLGAVSTLSVNDPPMQLHAWKLALRHPLTRERVEFVASNSTLIEAHFDPIS